MRAGAGLWAVAGALLFAPPARAEDLPRRDEAPWYEGTPSPFYDDGKDRLGWYVPDHARLGSGGFLGAVVVGSGYDLHRDVVELGASYGYTPPLDGAPAYHSLSAHLALRPLHVRVGRFVLVPAYVGGGVVRHFGPHLFVRQPPVYPRGYYPPTGLHATVYVGAELDWLAADGAIERHGVYWQAVTLGEYLSTLVRNSNLRAFDAFSTSVGYRATF